tara:strand:- start:788 stop:1009 length:222 start_codon:yes stop_codon:yes gene_type:complete
MNPFKAGWKSPKTTVAAILTAVSAVTMAAAMEFDGDPETLAHWETVIPMVIVAIGMFFSRDADTSSKETGLKE